VTIAGAGHLGPVTHAGSVNRTILGAIGAAPQV